eukprot:TRINITY_DN11343_c0_g1_i1.p1 TRINITY_DN11343_c0_g1~~TRINITY_DN11343_c0_g1_i1.p1  ORF type:complete len:271 (-),score=48.70 TRINITY_DN11343_c0_g1_i1:150-962(-)
MRILVLGSGGFIGQHLVTHLNATGTHEVVGTRSATLDLTDASAVATFFQSNERFEMVIHCAVAGGRRVKQDDASVLEANLRMVDNVLLQSASFGTMVHFTSGAALCAPHTPYGFSKRLLDALLRAQQNCYNIRVYGCFGPHEPDHRLISSCLRKTAAGEPCVVHQDKLFDFVHIDDLCKMVLRIVDEVNGDGGDKPRMPHEIDAVYQQKLSLSQVAGMVSDKVVIETEGMADPYIGSEGGELEALELGELVGMTRGVELLKEFLEAAAAE